MGRRDFLQDVKTVKEYLKGLSNKSGALIKGFDFSDPELSFRFAYKSGRSVTVRIYVNDTSLSAYPAKFSGLVCVDCADDDPSTGLAAECLKNANNVTENKPLCEVLGTIVKMLCEQFRISVPRDLSISTLKRSCGPLTTGIVGPSSSWSTNTSKSLPAPPIVQTPAMLLHRDLCELRHFGYNAELLCGDQIGFKVAISMPVSRLGLSYEACEAWNLESDRYLVCTMQFSSSYIDLQGVVANATTTKNYIVKEGGFSAVKESLKKQFPVSFHICTSSMAKGVPSQAHHKDEETESDHFVLSWTLMKLLSDKFFDMLCDRMWLGLGWAGAEHADMKRNKELTADYMNSAETFDDLEEALACDQVQHGVLTYFDDESVERATESANRNFLLLVMRFLRRRILLSTRFCLTCHYLHTESVSSIRPFVCGSALCEHQALVGLGNLFEAVLVSSPVVVDLLVSLCYVAVGAQNLKPYPSPAIGVTTTTRHDIPNSLVVEWSDAQGTIGTKSSTGYHVYGWKSFDDSVRAGDLLEVYHPDTQQPFSVSRLTQVTTVRVLVVTPGHLVTESPIVVPASVMPHRPVYLPFRVLRRVERNFLRNEGSPDYSLLQTTLDKIPHVAHMVQYAKRGTLKAELDKLDPLCFPLLSWIISSNRTHLRLLDSEEEKVRLADGGAYGNWRQFVMIMSSPEKEEIFQHEKDRLQLEKPLLGELYAFHGSPLNNWHSIIRTSLNYNRVAHGRAFGDGVYHSLNAGTSATYAGSTYYRNDTSAWKNSMLLVQKCMALCEIINRPTKFTSTHPHLVVRDESWITTRYLFVECLKDPMDNNALDDDYTYNYASNMPTMLLRPSVPSLPKPTYKQRRSAREFIKLDTQYFPTWLNGQPLQIPKRGFSIITHEAPACSSVGVLHFQYDPNAYDIRKDMGDSIKADPTFDAADVVSDEDDGIESEEDNDMDEDSESADDNYETVDDDMFREEETQHHESDDDDDVFDPTLLPLPSESSQFATQRICRELGAIVRKQSRTDENLGFRVDTNRIKSMYQWVVSLIDFDPSLPLARDMAKHQVQSVDLEVRFAPDYPYSPPYIRVIRPRLLRFINGGGGHVTAGGSICMDLLTTSGWSSVYTMEAVLLQIKMALSSTEPHPARLDAHWNTEYSPMEAIDSFIRVANTHGWGIPPQWRQLFGH